MFPRQWFPPFTQEGLSPDALHFEHLLHSSNFKSAKLFLASRLSDQSPYWSRQSKRLRHLYSLRNNYSNQPLKVYFSDFWPDLDVSNNQFLDLLRICINKPIITVLDPSLCDIALYSCYGDLSTLSQTKHAFRILFLGENVRPFYSEFDFSLSFDQSGYSGRNVYLPLWLLELDLFSSSYADRKPTPIHRVTSPLDRGNQFRQKKVIYIGNNCEPLRMNFINLLRRSGIPVDVYGQHTNPVEDKFSVYSSYEVALCPENSFYPGYCTEKLIHSFSAGCFSLYWGATDTLPFHSHPSIIRISPGSESTAVDSINRLFRAKSPQSFSSFISLTDLNSVFENVVLALSRKLSLYHDITSS